MIRHLVLLTLLSAPALATAQVSCANGTLDIDAEFDGGRLDHCEFNGSDSVELTFRAEDYRVSSAFSWFAFRVAADEPREITIKLQFPDSYARFWPKLSRDGHSWAPAPGESVARSEVGKSMTLTLDVDESDLWVAAQELLTARYYDDWLVQLDTHYELDTQVIGASRQGRPIHLANTGDKPEAIILHPLARGAELDRSLDDTPHNWYFAQARGAVFMRMALLSSILKSFT